VLSIFLHTIRDFVAACNDVKAFIANLGSLSTSVLVSDVIESETNVEN